LRYSVLAASLARILDSNASRLICAGDGAGDAKVVDADTELHDVAREATPKPDMPKKVMATR
jgi:hypothetical protein